MLDQISARHERDKGAMIRWLIRVAHTVGDVGKCSSHVRQVCVTEASAVRQVSDGEHAQDPQGQESGSSTPDPEKSKSKSKKKEPAQAPLSVTELILSDLNRRAGTGYLARGRKARELIASRMRDGASLEDFYTVNRKKAAEWLGTDMGRYLTYETLYGGKFEKYLGQPEQGAEAPVPRNADGSIDAIKLCGFDD